MVSTLKRIVYEKKHIQNSTIGNEIVFITSILSSYRYISITCSAGKRQVVTSLGGWEVREGGNNAPKKDME